MCLSVRVSLAVEPALPLSANVTLYGARAVACDVLVERAMFQRFDDTTTVSWSELGSRFQHWKWSTVAAIVKAISATSSDWYGITLSRRVH